MSTGKAVERTLPGGSALASEGSRWTTGRDEPGRTLRPLTEQVLSRRRATGWPGARRGPRPVAQRRARILLLGARCAIERTPPLVVTLGRSVTATTIGRLILDRPGL